MTARTGFISTILAASLALSAGTIQAALSDADKAFLDALASSDTTEIELSRLALTHPLSSPVRDFAQTMAADHDDNYQALLNLCREKEYAVAPRIDASHGEIMRKLRSADSSESAEHVYLDAIGSDQAAIDSLLEKIAGNSNDAEISRFAADTLAAVKNHEDSAKKLASK